MTVAAGVDACRGGWVAIVIDDGRLARSLLAATFPHLLGELSDAAAVGVDIPIGLPSEGIRAADRAARAYVGPRRSSVFPTPPRAALTASTYAEARAILPSLSAQSFALRTKVIEVEACLEERVFEAHPEVSFAALAGRHLLSSKRSWNGQMERRQLLAAAGIELPDALPAGHAGADDVLDAAIVAWSAARKARGEAATLPLDPPIQAGRPVAIWYEPTGIVPPGRVDPTSLGSRAKTANPRASCGNPPMRHPSPMPDADSAEVMHDGDRRERGSATATGRRERGVRR